MTQVNLKKPSFLYLQKEEETIGKLAKLREAICVYIDLTKKEVSKEEQRSKLLFDTINQVKQELNDTSKSCAGQTSRNRLHTSKRRLSPTA